MSLPIEILVETKIFLNNLGQDINYAMKSQKLLKETELDFYQ